MASTKTECKIGGDEYAPDVANSHSQGAGEPHGAPVHRNTDLGNAHEFANDHHADLRFVGDMKTWFLFDGVRWVADPRAIQVYERAKKTTHKISEEAAAAIKAASKLRETLQKGSPQNDRDTAERAGKDAFDRQKWAVKSHGLKELTAMIRLASSDSRIYIATADSLFDQHPDLLNCPNGTVDLRTGTIRPHSRADFLTKLCPVWFDPAATAPRYLRLLTELFPTDPEVAGYIRRLSGYVLTGRVSDQCVYFFVGAGSNGKSTLLKLWPAVLGVDYCYAMPPEVLLHGSGNRHPTERAGFRGARLAVASETQEDASVNESRLKALSGGDPITARTCGGDWFKFLPTHKILLATNTRPRIKATDDGTWRRPRMVEFKRRFWKDEDKAREALRDKDQSFLGEDKADPALDDQLAIEAEGILADMVAKAKLFYAEGLRLPAPPTVVKATAEYREDQDVLGQFFRDRLEKSDKIEMAGSQLYQEYKAWNASNGHNDANLVSTVVLGIRAKVAFEWEKVRGVVTYKCRLRKYEDKPK